MMRRIVLMVTVGAAMQVSAFAAVPTYPYPELPARLAYEWNADSPGGDSSNVWATDVNYNIDLSPDKVRDGILTNSASGVTIGTAIPAAASPMSIVSTSSSYALLPSTAYRFRGTYVDANTGLPDVATMDNWSYESNGFWYDKGVFGRTASQIFQENLPLGQMDTGDPDYTSARSDNLRMTSTFKFWIKPNATSWSSLGAALKSVADAHSSTYATEVIFENGSDGTSTGGGFHVGLRNNAAGDGVELVAYSTGGSGSVLAATNATVVLALTDDSLLDDYMQVALVFDDNSSIDLGLFGGAFTGTNAGTTTLYVNDGSLSATDTVGGQYWFSGRQAAALGGGSTYLTPDAQTSGTSWTTNAQPQVGGAYLVPSPTWFISFDGDIALAEAYDNAFSASDVEAEWNFITSPEPASMMLMAMGGLLILNRRRQA